MEDRIAHGSCSGRRVQEQGERWPLRHQREARQKCDDDRYKQRDNPQRGSYGESHASPSDHEGMIMRQVVSMAPSDDEKSYVENYKGDRRRNRKDYCAKRHILPEHGAVTQRLEPE